MNEGKLVWEAYYLIQQDQKSKAYDDVDFIVDIASTTLSVITWFSDLVFDELFAVVVVVRYARKHS